MERRLGRTRTPCTFPNLFHHSSFLINALVQGKGAFGSVVKARNKIDNRIYAVKKIRLKTQQSDSKIFREVNALSRLSHRFIVRYFTTWVETSENTNPASAAPSASELSSSADESGGGGGGGGGRNSGVLTFSVPSSPATPGSRATSTLASRSRSRSAGGDEDGDEDEDDEDDEDDRRLDSSASTVSERHLPTNGGGFSINDFDDFDDNTTTTTEISGASRGSFPSIHFDRSTSPGGSTEEEDDTEGEGSNGSSSNNSASGSGSGSGAGESEFGGLFRRDPVTGAITAGLGSGRSGDGGGGRRSRRRAGTVVGDRNAASTVHPMAITITTPNGHRNGVSAANEDGRKDVPYPLNPIPNVTRTLYIQMEFVERQTLREVRVMC
jgi:translation initiation factor 2-alpha kinase 4